MSNETTPFPDGATVFSKCAACPELPKEPGHSSGPATLCGIYFSQNGGDTAGVICFYGPGGSTTSSIANGAVTDVPNLFGYCQDHCPDDDALYGCNFEGDENGTRRFDCSYGKSCD